MCALNYPVEDQYLHCLRCGSQTNGFDNAKPMDADDLAEVRAETGATNEQILIVRDCPHNGIGCDWSGCQDREHVVSTAYDPEQADRAFKLAVQEHGTHAGIRQIAAALRVPADDGPTHNLD